MLFWIFWYRLFERYDDITSCIYDPKLILEYFQNVLKTALRLELAKTKSVFVMLIIMVPVVRISAKIIAVIMELVKKSVQTEDNVSVNLDMRVMIALQSSLVPTNVQVMVHAIKPSVHVIKVGGYIHITA